MQPDARSINVTSTLQGEKVGMTIDDSALAHIMSVLTDLYSDPVLAVIREYSTNAFDAHIEAGVSLPVEVTTPSALSPFFKVRDYGEGLDAEDIRNIYSRYGTSTKRDSNDVVGMLGLGCKSALTYTDQFTLQGIKNGVCTQVAISRDENGAGSMTIVAQYPTDEASGVEVSVPVKGSDTKFETTANDFFRFWDEGTVLVNGKEPKRIDGLWIADDICITNDVDTSYVVMGNVAYPFHDWNRYKTVAFVNIGDVSFTPSREALQMNAKTYAKVKEIQKRVEDEKSAAVQKLVDAATDRHEGLKVAFQAQHMFGTKFSTLSYQGDVFPEAFEAYAEGKDGQKFVTVATVKRYRQKGWDKARFLPTSILSKTMFVTGYNGTDFTPTKREKLGLWIAEQPEGFIAPEQFVFVAKLPNPKWIEKHNVVKWDAINAMKIVRESRAGAGREDGRPTGSYVGYVAGSLSDEILAEEINTNNRTGLFYTGHDMGSQYIAILRIKYPNCTLVELPGNRQDKFKRMFPKARPAHEVAKTIAENWVKNLSVEDTMAINFEQMGRYGHQYLGCLDASEIEDEDLAKAIEVYKNKSQVNRDYNKVSRFLHNTKFEDLVSDTLARYPLLTSNNWYGKVGDVTKQHIVMYVNAANAARKES